MEEKILAVGAHPDDIEFGCGGTISKHLELGDEVYIIVMTNGEKGSHPSDKKECLNSLKLMGIKESNIFFGNFLDGYLQDNREVVNFIEEIITKFNITKVYSHSQSDRHQDHRNCSKAVCSAARKISEILLFEESSTEVSFKPHYFVELSKEHIKKKIDSLSCYKSQIKRRGINLKLVEYLAGANGRRCNSEYSEAFEINHIIKKGKDV